MGMSIPMLTKMIKYDHMQTTKNHQDLVLKALGGYVLKNGVLPCPANSLSGESPLECSSLADVRGIVPFSTLNMSKSYALDGMGRYFTYVVDAGFTKAQSSHKKDTFCFVSRTSSPIVIKDLPIQETNPIVLMLISHGTKGHGAINQEFKKIFVEKASIDEEENANEDLVFQDSSPRLKNMEFDHIVKWVAKDLFAAFYMNTPCKASAADIPLEASYTNHDIFQRR